MKELHLEKISPIDKDNIIVDDYSILVESKRNIRNYYLLPDFLRETFSFSLNPFSNKKKRNYIKEHYNFICKKGYSYKIKDINPYNISNLDFADNKLYYVQFDICGDSIYLEYDKPNKIYRFTFNMQEDSNLYIYRFPKKILQALQIWENPAFITSTHKNNKDKFTKYSPSEKEIRSLKKADKGRSYMVRVNFINTKDNYIINYNHSKGFESHPELTKGVESRWYNFTMYKYELKAFHIWGNRAFSIWEN